MTRQPDLLDDSEEVTRKFNHKKHEATLRKLVAQGRLGVRLFGRKLQVIKLQDSYTIAGEVCTQVRAYDVSGFTCIVSVYSLKAKQYFEKRKTWDKATDATFALIHDPTKYSHCQLSA